MTERWAEFLTETPELDFFQGAIGRFGQPVLDVACGTGRLLLPLLRLGIDIDGCDISACFAHVGENLEDPRCASVHAYGGIRPK